MKPLTSNTYRDDKELVRGCAQGDAEQREIFAEKYGRLIRAAVARAYASHGAPQHDTEDVVNHVYEKLLEDDCRRLRAWNGDAKLSTYLVQVTRNLAVDCLRKQGRDGRLKNLDELPPWFKEIEMPRVAESAEPLLDALQDAINELTPKRTMIIKLRLKGHSLREIAKLLNLPEGTVSVENSRALQALRKKLFAVNGMAERGAELLQEEL